MSAAKRRRGRWRLLAVVLASAVVAMAGPAWGQALTVSAAASLADAMREIGRRFEVSHSGTPVRFNFGASGMLVQQLVHGAPVDVLVTADAESMDRAARARVVDPATRRDFARNELVLIAPSQGAPGLRALRDLAAPAIRRIAIGKPATVPAGRYARVALESAGLWAAAEARMVYADHVRQALDYVARGEVDAGFVYRTDASAAKDRVRLVAAVELREPIVYPAALATGSPQAAEARRFLDFLSGSEARQVLAAQGFGAP